MSLPQDSLSYISNCDRRDIIPVLRAYADKVEKEMHEAEKKELHDKFGAPFSDGINDCHAK
ncbi:MAG: hypothetical protein GY714_03805 [Desulfobacterales bacterium]|nr:hypothetical protein [Desulfobacterales bacterium]